MATAPLSWDSRVGGLHVEEECAGVATPIGPRKACELEHSVGRAARSFDQTNRETARAIWGIGLDDVLQVLSQSRMLEHSSSSSADVVLASTSGGALGFVSRSRALAHAQRHISERGMGGRPFVNRSRTLMGGRKTGPYSKRRRRAWKPFSPIALSTPPLGSAAKAWKTPANRSNIDGGEGGSSLVSSRSVFVPLSCDPALGNLAQPVAQLRDRPQGQDLRRRES